MALLQPAKVRHGRTIDGLTSLRFLAAFWVLALHYTDQMPHDLQERTSFFQQGQLGVDFFFVLSGFILTHVYVRELAARRFRYGLFLQRRLARIYPLHVGSFLLVVGYVLAGRLAGVTFRAPDAYAASEIPPNLLLLHAWGWGRMSWNYVSWSISAEWFAYLLFPALTWLSLRPALGPWSRLAAALALMVAMYVAVEQVIGVPLTHLTSLAIFRILPEFVLGIALYHLSARYDLAARTALLSTLVGVSALLTVAHLGASDLGAVLLLGFLVFATASLERLGKATWLRDRRLIYLGEISYAIYMLHAILFIVYFKILRITLGDAYEHWAGWLGPPAILLTIGAAALAHHVVELPCRRFFGRPDLLALGRGLGRGESALGRGEAPGSSSGGRR